MGRELYGYVEALVAKDLFCFTEYRVSERRFEFLYRLETILAGLDYRKFDDVVGWKRPCMVLAFVPLPCVVDIHSSSTDAMIYAVNLRWLWF